MPKLEYRSETIEDWAPLTPEKRPDWVSSPSQEWTIAWRSIDPGITPCDIIPKLGEIASSLRKLGTSGAARSVLLSAARHLLEMCFADGRSPSVIRPTADGGIVFYFFPPAGDRSIYGCLEIFDDGEVVAAYADPHCDNAWDLGSKPDMKSVAAALEKIDAFISPAG